MLEVTDLSVSYGAIAAAAAASRSGSTPGAIVTLIGGNGAGKTTTLRTRLRPAAAASAAASGSSARTSRGLPAHRIVARGLGHVPEGRLIFSNLTVEENLAMGAYLQGDAAAIARNRDYVFGIFPRLKERLRQTAGTLSGRRAADARDRPGPDGRPRSSSCSTSPRSASRRG